MKILLLVLLLFSLQNLTFIQAQDAQAPDMTGPILPATFWSGYDSEALALAKAESGSPEEQRKAAVTLFLLSRAEEEQSKALELVRKASEIINPLYRSKPDDLRLGLLYAQINMGVAGKSKSIMNRIRYTNRGLPEIEALLAELPDNLEAKQMYLRNTIYIPTFFKNLTKEQRQQIQLFLNGYDKGMQKLQNPEERQRLEELKTHVMIMAAKIADRSRKTRKDIPEYLAQVDTSFFETMKAQNNEDLVEMYEELKE